MASIDVSADDKGLQACLSLAHVREADAKKFISHHQMTTLEDFVYLVAHDSWESGIQTLVDAVPEFKDQKILVARIKAAWSTGKEALKQAAVPSTKASDLDEPLPDNTLKALNHDWTKRYNIQFDPTLEPSEALRSRVYREFKKGQMTVVEAKKVKSMVAIATPKQQEKVSISSDVQLEFQSEPGVSIRTALEYYFQLRTLVAAWAWAGNYQVTWEGTQVFMIGLSEALAYADTALKDCYEFGGGSLAWLQRNDLLTRGKMATLVRRGFPAGVALEKALRETHLEWRSPVPAISGSSPAKRQADPPSDEMQPPKRKAKTPGGKGGSGIQTVSMTKGSRKLCKAWNDGRGCRNSNCPDMHACDVRMPSGRACLERHTRLQHGAS